MLKQGVLAEWQRGSELDDALDRVAGTIPLNGAQLNPGMFVLRVREEVGGQIFVTWRPMQDHCIVVNS